MIDSIFFEPIIINAWQDQIKHRTKRRWITLALRLGVKTFSYLFQIRVISTSNIYRKPEKILSKQNSVKDFSFVCNLNYSNSKFVNLFSVPDPRGIFKVVYFPNNCLWKFIKGIFITSVSNMRLFLQATFYKMHNYAHKQGCTDVSTEHLYWPISPSWLPSAYP